MPDAQNPHTARTVVSPVPDIDGTVPGIARATNSEFNLSAPLAPGDVGALGPYRLVKELGRGAMGAVYLAVDTRLDRELALKVMLPELAADPGAKERFLREAKAVAKVAHDHVVTIYEADERDGVPYIAMQFLQGAPLDEYLKKKGAPPLAHCVRIAREAALGLAAAHAQGLVHRDIKPANLWLEAPNGRVKVLDFGLAKPIGSDSELTKSGAIVGSPAYMSPEQARAQKVDHRSDIFSLGAVLYRLLAGRNPFLGDHIMAVLTALAADEPPPVRELNPNVPEPLADLVHQLLSKRPDARPQSAAEVAERLRTILSQPTALSAPVPVIVPLQVPAQESAFANLIDDENDADRTERETAPVRPTDAPKIGKFALIAGGAVALVAAVGVAIALGTGGKKPDDVAKQPNQPAPPPVKQPRSAPPQAPQPPAPTVTDNPGPIGPARKAPELFALRGHTSLVFAASFSTDGTRIVTGSGDNTAKVWEVPSGKPEGIAKPGAELLTLKGHTDQVNVAVFSRDGTRVLTASHDKTARVWDAKAGAQLLAFKGHKDIVLAGAFSPDGTHVVTGSLDNATKVWDAKTGAELFALGGHTSGVTAVSFSPDGTRIVTGSHDNTVRVWDAKTRTELFTLNGHTGSVTGVSFSPDGTRIVTSGDETAKVWELPAGKPEGGAKPVPELFTLKGHTRTVRNAMFSSDGTRIVTASHDRTAKVWDAKTGTELLTIDGQADLYDASFNSDATRIVTGSGDHTAKVWDVRPSTDPITNLTPAGETEWSKLWVARGAQDWKLQDGRLVNGGTYRGWIGTKAEYTDFEIELEYKLPPRGNSGIFLRAWAEGEISGSEFVEVQLIDDAALKTTGKNCTGAVFNRAEPNPRPVTKVDEWNAATVRVVGKRVTVTINGTKCVDAEVEFPRAKGFVALQQLDSPVEFRAVRVRDLSAEKR